MDAIKIFVSRNLDGTTFTILPSTLQQIKKEFPGSAPTLKIWRSNNPDQEQSIALNPTILHWVINALLGLPETIKSEQLPKVEWFDSNVGKWVESVAENG